MTDFNLDNVDLSPDPGTVNLIWHSERDWKGEMKKKKVNLHINIEGVAVTRRNTKKLVTARYTLDIALPTFFLRPFRPGPESWLLGLVSHQKLGCSA
jgi:hypothetical protein